MYLALSTPASAYCTDDERWLAVGTRDPQADGQFFTCVHPTGIYCRPTCPAAEPKVRLVRSRFCDASFMDLSDADR